VRSEQESGVREIRPLRLTRRELETWPWWNCEPSWQSKEPVWKPFTYSARASSRPYWEGLHRNRFLRKEYGTMTLLHGVQYDLIGSKYDEYARTAMG
jgi:hypothetical protein